MNIYNQSLKFLLSVFNWEEHSLNPQAPFSLVHKGRCPTQFICMKSYVFHAIYSMDYPSVALFLPTLILMGSPSPCTIHAHNSPKVSENALIGPQGVVIYS